MYGSGSGSISQEVWIRIRILLSFWLMNPDPDPWGLKTCGSGGSGSGTLLWAIITLYWMYSVLFILPRHNLYSGWHKARARGGPLSPYRLPCYPLEIINPYKVRNGNFISGKTRHSKVGFDQKMEWLNAKFIWYPPKRHYVTVPVLTSQQLTRVWFCIRDIHYSCRTSYIHKLISVRECR